MSQRFDTGRTIAMTWVVATVCSFVLLGPMMGIRGWMWLCVNAVLCIFGAGWEIWQKEQRR